MRVAEALARARALGVDRLDAQVLLARRLGCPRSWLLAHDDEQLGPAPLEAYLEDAARRAAGVPLAYLVGQREFHGLLLNVTRQVLIPRPETELLVDWALEVLAASGNRSPAVVDLGTGSGAIALVLKQRHPSANVVATDADPGALEVARGNASALGSDVEFVQGDWWQPLEGRRFDLAVSNPPYIAADDPHLDDLTLEPRQALTPGPDGLDALRRVVDAAPEHLEPGGWLLLEHGWDQAGAVRAMLAGRGLREPATRRDLAGHERCSGARRGRPTRV